MNLSTNTIVSTFILLIVSTYLTTKTTIAIGHNGRVDMLQTVNHKEEIESLLKKRYGTADTTASKSGGKIHHVKDVDVDNVSGSGGVDNGHVVDGNNRNSATGVKKMNDRKTLFMAAQNGKCVRRKSPFLL